jgi:hypothetical protein
MIDMNECKGKKRHELQACISIPIPKPTNYMDWKISKNTYNPKYGTCPTRNIN